MASRYKVARPLRTKKTSGITFVLEAIYKKSGVFKYPKALQIDNGLEFNNEVTKLLEKHNVEIRRATAKIKKPIWSLWRHLARSCQNCCLNQWMLKSLKNLKKYQRVKYLNKTVSIMNNTVSSIIGMKPKETIKLGTVPLDKIIQQKLYYPRMDYIDTFINLVNNMETKKDRQQTSFAAKIRID